MARDEFLANLRDAVNAFLSPHIQVDGIRLDDEHVAQALHENSAWLRPRYFEGLNPADFPEMSGFDREKLERSVRMVQGVAARALRNGSASSDDVEHAVSRFLAVLRILTPHLEWFREYDALKHDTFPDYVRDHAIRVGEDWTGDPGVWVWVVIRDEYSGWKFPEPVTDLVERVHTVLRRAGIERFPYVSMRTETEQKELEASAVS
jgi:hypothetical protein